MKENTSGYHDGSWAYAPASSIRRRRHGRRALASLLILFAFSLGQASLIAIADEPATETATEATDTTEATDAPGSTESPEADPATVATEEEAADTVDAAEEPSSVDETAGSVAREESEVAPSADTTGSVDGSEAEVAAPDTPGPPSGDGVQPILVAGNPSCLDVMAEAQFLFEHTQDPPQDATINLTFGDLSGTLVVAVNESAQTFSFTLTGDFVAAGVIVKGGSNANFYDYRPNGNAADTGLHAPINPANGKFYGLSHISFCLDDVPRVPELEVTKSCPDSVPFGEDIEYTITVENTGTDALVDVVVTDTLLGDITADFDVDLSAGLAVGVTATAVVTYSPGPNEDPVTNTVTAEAVGQDSDAEASASAQCETDVTHVAELEVTKSCPDSVPFGEDIEYTITVENTGTDALVDVVVTDTLLGDITADFDVDLSAGLAVGVTATAVVTYSPGPNEDPVTNTVTAEAVGQDSDAEASASAQCETDVTNPLPAIQIVKGGPALVHRGDTITYQFEVTNTGDVELFDVELTDPRCDVGTIDPGDDVDGSLAVDEVWHFTCTHLVTQADPDPIPNTATVRGDTQEGEGGDEVTDVDDHVVDIIHPAISIVKTVSDGSVLPGTVVTYTYVVTNTGDTTLFDISVDDDVLGHIGTIPSLAAGASATLTKTFTVGDSPVTNVGTASGSDVLGETVTDDDDALVEVILGTGGGSPSPGPDEGPDCCIGAGGGGTPFTGSDIGNWALLAGALALMGGLALWVSRRRIRPTA